jgi:cytidine deaminase
MSFDTVRTQRIFMCDISQEIPEFVIEDLIEASKKVRHNAYAPYSHFKVGAALLGEDGVIYSGCNVENISYGLTICAERAAVFAMVAAGCKAIKACVVATEIGTMPCGACRQVLAEFVRDDAPIYLVNTATDGVVKKTLCELLPEKVVIRQDSY